MSEAIARQLSHRQELPYRAVLSEKNGKFYFYQPELNLIASGDTVAAAYENFHDVRLEFLHEIERAGLENELPAPRTRRVAKVAIGERGIAREIGMFIAKTAIVFIIIGLIAAAGLAKAERAVGRLAGLGNLGSGLHHISLVDFVNKAALHAEAMPAARKEQLRQSIGILAREAKPFVDALVAPYVTPAPTAHPARKP